LLLINIARLLKFDAEKDLPPPSDKEESLEIQESYWPGLFKDIRELKINFKNCLLVVGRNLTQLFLAGAEAINDWLPRAITSVARVRQKIRPGRHYPRLSHKPGKKWWVKQQEVTSNA